jgi:hypothetical protein
MGQRFRISHGQGELQSQELFGLHTPHDWCRSHFPADVPSDQLTRDDIWARLHDRGFGRRRYVTPNRGRDEQDPSRND